MELYAKIKRTSKYAYQGEDERGRARVMRVVEISTDGEYPFRLNGNCYRQRDLNFYVRNPRGELVKLGR